MNFNPVFMMQHPREIPEVIASVHSVVNIPRVWFKAFVEREVLEAMNNFVAETSYSHYFVSSDDAIIYKKSFDACLKYCARDNLDVFTGYCNMHIEKPPNVLSDVSNIQLNPLRLADPRGPSVYDYGEWTKLKEVFDKEGLFRQYLAGMALSCFSRETLLEFPLGVYSNGFAGDHNISYRLQQQGVKIWTHPDAFLLHLRRGWRPMHDSWKVGKIVPQIIYELDVSKHEAVPEGISSRFRVDKLELEVMPTSRW